MSPQTVLAGPTLAGPPLWRDTLLLPVYLAAFSAVYLFLVAVVATVRKQTRKESTDVPSKDVDREVPVKSGLARVSVAQVLEGSRVVAAGFFLVLSVLSAIRIKNLGHITELSWIVEVAQVVFFAYILGLSAGALFFNGSTGRELATHRNVLLLVDLAVFTYRDVWPLATYTLKPVDEQLGWITWTRVAILVYVAVVVPLAFPGVYVPIDPENPTTPNSEQLSSLFSQYSYGYVDPLISTALKHEHLPYDELPLLSDDDQSGYLKKASFPLLDPTVRKSNRHIGWTLLRFYTRHAVAMVLSVTTRAVMDFVSPVALYQILRYVETEGEGATIKPWLWIAALLMRAVLETTVNHRYLYLVTKLMVQMEAIITQLVFEHALRIRMKEERAAPKAVTSTTSDAASGVTAGEDNAASEATAAPSTSASDQASTTTKDKDADAEETKGGNLVGKINNLISSDLENIVEMTELPIVVVYTPIKIALSVWFLYLLLGWSSFVGMGLMVLGLIIPGKLAGLLHGVQTERAKKIDARIQAVTESVGLLRLVKMFGWEAQTEERLRGHRETELIWIRKYFVYGLLNNQVSWVIPLFTLLATYFTFTVIMKQELNELSILSQMFSSLGVLGSLRDAVFMVIGYVPMLITAKVSTDRVDEFLRNTEMLDEYSVNTSLHTANQTANTNSGDIGFHNARFTWSAGATGATTPSSRNFALRADDVIFKHGALNLIIGPTGSGKTSLLLGLLGEMHFDPTELDAWFNLPRDGGVAYCAQEAWIVNDTIKGNIIFGQEFDEARYKKVLHECALDRDLELFEAGDETEVGEKGLTLSGGQKARVSLARAVYSKATIVLMDDVLSALDVHTAKSIVDNCLKGELLRNRTVILVTHNLAMTLKYAGLVVAVSTQGVATTRAASEDAVAHDSHLQSELATEVKAADAELDDQVDEPKETIPDPATAAQGKGKLIADEEVALGHVSTEALLLYLKSMGGLSFWVSYLVAIGTIDIVDMFQTWWLGHWSEQYETTPAGQVDVGYYIAIYAVAVLTATGIFFTSQWVWIGGSIRASRVIHERLTKAILNTTLRFLDRTPVGRIIQRFTMDIRAIDGPLSERTESMLQLTVHMIQRLSIIVWFTPAFLLPGAVLAVAGLTIAQLYIKAQLPVKRELSLARAPLISHFGAAMHGLTSIRAYGVQESFKQETLKRIDKYSRVARPYWNLNRWIGLRIDVLGGVFSSFLAWYLVYVSKPNASNIGFQLNVSFLLTSLFFWWVRIVNMVEIQGNSLERIQQYVDIEQETPPTKEGEPPAAWPSSGALSVESLSARYTPDGADVLHDLTFKCESGEKVGIVGRTGSGKSSLTLSLLRLIPTTGEVYYDGLATSKLNLGSLRGSITIIPQQPELMSGTIRENLDPFSEHDDAELNDALRSAGLTNLQEELVEEERISLDTSVSSAGGNFSLGQRQIIALARALVRRSKILILDEATASMDHKTDALIQESLRTQFRDCTVLTIAHRLHTIMDADKILVLDAGRLVEFASPANLLATKGSTFKAMVDGSGDKEALYALVGSVANR